jgi:hypothetical protein
MPSNEVSGVAIQARQRVSDTGTVIYHDNLTLAQEECGRVMNELIGTVYDTPRIVKVLGQDAKGKMAGDQSGWKAGNGYHHRQVCRHRENRAELRHQAH